MGVYKAEESDSVWSQLNREVVGMAESEPMLASYLHATVLTHRTIEDALSYLLASKLETPYLSAMSIREVISQAFRESAQIREAIRQDLSAVLERDPAARGVAQPFLHYKGFHALESHRVAHWLWCEERAFPGFLLAEPDIRSLRRRHPSRCQDRQGNPYRPRHQCRHR